MLAFPEKNYILFVSLLVYLPVSRLDRLAFHAIYSIFVLPRPVLFNSLPSVARAQKQYAFTVMRF